MQPSDAIAILPEIILTAAGILVMLLGAFFEKSERIAAGATYAGLIAAIIAVAVQFNHPVAAFGGVFLADSFGCFFRLLFLLIALLVVLSSSTYLHREGLSAAEYYALLLFGTVGMGVMASANELILVFIGLEISSLASYVLVGFRRDVPTSSEASLKYFLLGSFATAFFLYGVALMFGSTGSTRLTQINEAFNTALRGQSAGTPVHPAAANLAVSTQFPASLVGVAIALMFVGLAFKVSAAPFQIWTPDVYQGAPTPVTAFLSTAPKAAAFAAFLRIFMVGLGAYSGRWSWLLWIVAVLSMFLGNLGALLQANIKRMLAYSAIAHAGYVLVAFTTHSADGVAAVLYYLVAYAFMNIGAFLVVTHLGGRGERYLEIEDYAGLGFRFPFLAGMFSIFLLSLIGVPLTAGFLGKFYVFRAAIHGDLVWLTVLGVLNSGIAAYYYLRVLVSMYMSAPAREVPCEPLRAPERLALAISVVGTLYLGLFPQNVMDLATQAAQWLQQAR
ncbi:MAG: NADH-quinone oxidoreductase subunit N [Acidobacteria bacterium]|nr:NADH-quinone oxidoreductase subunit N [Acidobacteriota bacterium]